MRKQELIKRIEDLPYTEGPIADTIEINRNWILKSIEQLAESETGHADEAPRYVKNILARLRELPSHDREVWLKAIMSEFEQDFSRAKWREGYEQGKLEGAWVGNQLKDADKIRSELNKVQVPQFVADWIEVCKEHLTTSLYTAMNPDFMKENNQSFDFILWIKKTSNQETFALAWIFGYEVEKEKRYIVRVKGVEEDNAFLNYYAPRNEWFMDSSCDMKDIRAFHTRKELEEAGFDWVFDCPGIEIEEVE